MLRMIMYISVLLMSHFYPQNSGLLSAALHILSLPVAGRLYVKAMGFHWMQLCVAPVEAQIAAAVVMWTQSPCFRYVAAGGWTKPLLSRILYLSDTQCRSLCTFILDNHLVA